jgi:hypothetical protein
MPVPSNWSVQLREFVLTWKAETDRSKQEQYLGDRPFDNFVHTEHATSWQDYSAWLEEVSGWCFRGQREASWPLDTSLDRAVKVSYSATNGSRHSSGYFHLDRETEQRELFRRFQEQTLHLDDHLPAVADTGSWLALMQHHGVPTRLLDWTQSPHVALYFAIADEPSEANAALWSLDLEWLRVKSNELLGNDAPSAPNHRGGGDDYINQLLGQSEAPFIVRIEPLSTSERMAAQQGLLLCKLLHQATFSQILMSMMIHPDVPAHPIIRKLTIDKNLRIEFLTRLQEMNIHNASLFPGIDGLGRRLKLDLEIKVKGAAASAAAVGPR